MSTRKNTYWLLRHGRSLANEAGIIVSIKENGVKPEYGLAELGQQQATEAGRLLRVQRETMIEPGTVLPPLQVYCSPFIRTIQTAKLAAEAAEVVLDDSNFHLADELVERYFGAALELQDHASHYATTWAHDEVDDTYIPGGDGESVRDVAARVQRLVDALEAQYENTHILLVAHGDTLSIGCAQLQGTGLKQHRIHSFETAELRLLP